MSPNPVPSLDMLRPAWLRRSEAFGTLSALAFFAAFVMHEIEWRHELLGLVRNTAGGFALGLAIGLLFAEHILMQRYQRAITAWHEAEECNWADFEQQAAFIRALKREAASAQIDEAYLSGADLFQLLANFELLGPHEGAHLLEAAQARADSERAPIADAVASRGGFSLKIDDEIPF